MAADLPRLLVLADVNVERTGGGALLLYRLLRDYPKDRLVVFYNPSLAQASEDILLPGVRYDAFPYKVSRYVRNRYNPSWPYAQALLMRAYTGRVFEMLAGFEPEAVLSVSHWFLWFTAARVARRLGVPLHLILHDDWAGEQTHNRPGRIYDLVRRVCHAEMGRVYRNAHSRLCVSPGMAERYRDWFGAEGEVLYPSRGEDSPVPRVRVRPEPGDRPVIAFCGAIHHGGTTDSLASLAGALEGVGGHLDFYTTLTSEDLASRGLKGPVVRRIGFLPPREMAERLGQTAHVLLQPSSFLPHERDVLSTLFPSKLADYTAVGLPIVIWGPEYTSAVRWGRENPGASVIVNEPHPSAVLAAAQGLAGDPERSARIASAAVEAGNRYFDVRAAQKRLVSALQSFRA